MTPEQIRQMADRSIAGRIDTYAALAAELQAKGYYLTSDMNSFDLYVQRKTCKGAKLQWQGDDDVNQFRVAYFSRADVMDMQPNFNSVFLPNKREFL